jgi:uncharacterized protein YcbK (DUF882 family)
MTRRLLTTVAAGLLSLIAIPAHARTVDWDRSDGPFARYSTHTEGEPSAEREHAERSPKRAVSRHPRSDRQRDPTAANLAVPKLPPLALLPPSAELSALPPRSDGMRGCLKGAARELLARIESQFGPMRIISTCRPGARIAGTNVISKHATGEAIDFEAGSRKGDVVRWLIANHKAGGTMTYAGMSHIHVDIGSHFVALNSGRR